MKTGENEDFLEHMEASICQKRGTLVGPLEMFSFLASKQVPNKKHAFQTSQARLRM